MVIEKKCKQVTAYLSIINVQKHVFLRNRMREGYRDRIEVNTDDFIDILSDGIAYFCYRHVIENCHEDIDYQLKTLKAYAEGEIRIALSDIMIYSYKAKKNEDTKDIFVGKKRSVYKCLDKNLSSDERRNMANKSRKLDRVRILSKIIFRARTRNVHHIYKVTKRKTIKFNVAYLLNELNKKLAGIGMHEISQSTIYRYISGDDSFIEVHKGMEDTQIEGEILEWCKKFKKWSLLDSTPNVAWTIVNYKSLPFQSIGHLDHEDIQSMLTEDNKEKLAEIYENFGRES